MAFLLATFAICGIMMVLPDEDDTKEDEADMKMQIKNLSDPNIPGITTSYPSNEDTEPVDFEVTTVPVEVPKLLGDWLDYYDKQDRDVSDVNEEVYAWVTDYAENNLSEKLQRWADDDTNYYMALQAILYGYTVKKDKLKLERKWLIKVPHTKQLSSIEGGYVFNLYFKDKEGILTTTGRKHGLKSLPIAIGTNYLFNESELDGLGINKDGDEVIEVTNDVRRFSKLKDSKD